MIAKARRHSVSNFRVRLVSTDPNQHSAWGIIACRDRQDHLHVVSVMAARRGGDDFGRNIQDRCGLSDDGVDAIAREHHSSLSPTPRGEGRAPPLCRLGQLLPIVANARASRFTIDEEAKFPAEVVCPDFADCHTQPILVAASKREQVIALQRLTSPERTLQNRHRSAEPIMLAREGL
jgi:hypothetical protein